jgi:hypothetical protein
VAAGTVSGYDTAISKPFSLWNKQQSKIGIFDHA